MNARRFPRLVRYLPFAAIAVGAVAFMPADQDAIGLAGSAGSAVTTTTASLAPEPVAAAPQPTAPGAAGQPAPRAAQIATVEVSPRPFVPAIATLEPVTQPEAAPAPWVDTETLLAAAASLPVEGLPQQSAADSGAERLAELGRVGASALNVRAGPSTSSAVLFVLRAGQEVRVGETEGGWVRVQDDSGTSGWVYSRYVSTGRTAAAEPAAQPRRSTQPEATAVASARSTEPEPRRTVTSTVVNDGNASMAGRHARLDSDMALRAGPFNNAPRLLVLGAGERVAIAETRGGWMRVRTSNGVSGWVRYR